MKQVLLLLLVAFFGLLQAQSPQSNPWELRASFKLNATQNTGESVNHYRGQARQFESEFGTEANYQNKFAIGWGAGLSARRLIGKGFYLEAGLNLQKNLLTNSMQMEPTPDFAHFVKQHIIETQDALFFVVPSVSFGHRWGRFSYGIGLESPVFLSGKTTKKVYLDLTDGGNMSETQIGSIDVHDNPAPEECGISSLEAFENNHGLNPIHLSGSVHLAYRPLPKLKALELQLSYQLPFSPVKRSLNQIWGLLNGFVDNPCDPVDVSTRIHAIRFGVSWGFFNGKN